MLENVQVGDTLILNGRCRIVDSRIVLVDRLTKTQIIVNGNRYRKSDGYSVGKDTWSTAMLMIPREGEIDRILAARLHRKLVNSIDDACHINKLRDMSLGQLQQLNALLETL